MWHWWATTLIAVTHWSWLQYSVRVENLWFKYLRIIDLRCQDMKGKPIVNTWVDKVDFCTHQDYKAVWNLSNIVSFLLLSRCCCSFKLHQPNPQFLVWWTWQEFISRKTHTSCTSLFRPPERNHRHHSGGNSRSGEQAPKKCFWQPLIHS